MFASVPYHVVKAAHGLPPALTSPTKSKRPKLIKGSSDHQSRPKENTSLTGWSHGNSPNASGIVGESFRCNNVATSTNRATEANLQSPKEKPKENSLEIKSPEEPKEIPLNVISTLDTKGLDIMPENPREENLQTNSKKSRESIMRNLKASVVSRPVTVVKTQKSADFNSVTYINQTAKTLELPISIPTSPGHRTYVREGIHSPTSLKHQMHRTSYSKLLADPSRTSNDFKVFRMAKLKTDTSHNTEKRAVTALKTRAQQTLYVPTTVLNGSKLIKCEDPTKQKNLRLSKPLCLWTQTSSQNNISAFAGDSIGLKFTEPLSLESPGCKSFSQTSVGIITTKVFNFMGKQGSDSIDSKQLGPLPQFKPTMKVRRPIEDEKSDLELSSPPPKYDILKMRQTSPIAFYNKDWESSNGFKRKSSRNIGQRSEIKRRPTNDIFKDDTDLLSQEFKEEGKDAADETQSGRKNMTQRVMERVAKIVKKKSLEGKELVFEVDQDDKKPKKPPEPRFLKIEAKIEVDGKSLKRSGKNVRIGSSSVELSKGIKDLLEIRTDTHKVGSIKNFRLFENQ